MAITDPYYNASYSGALGGMFALQAGTSTDTEDSLPYNAPVIAANAFAIEMVNLIPTPEDPPSPQEADLLRKLCQAWWRNRNPNAMGFDVYSNPDSYAGIVHGILAIFFLAFEDLQ